MAQSRMFNKTIISSARFVKMQQETQALYFHLAINADDDGVVEAFIIMRMIGATEDSLKVLQAKNFVTVLNEDLVAFITDWTTHNKLRPDRKIDSKYKSLLLKMLPEAKIIHATERSDTQNSRLDGPRTDIGRHSIGKVSIEEVSKVYTASDDAEDKKTDGIDFLLTKKKKKLIGKRLQTFYVFWEKFNYKKGKREAADSWLNIPILTDALVHQIYEAAEQEAQQRPVIISEGKTPKMAQGWISASRWEDEVSTENVQKLKGIKV